MVSVSNLLASVFPSTARLLGGAGGLQRQVTWAATMRTRPPAFEALRGGECALLSLSTLGALHEVDASLTLAKVVQSLNDAAVAAVVVTGLDEPRLDDDAAQAVALANERSLPLIALPRRVPLVDVERDIIAFVVNHRGDIEQRAGEVYQEVLALSLQRAGVQEMIERLAQADHKVALLEDAHAGLLNAAIPPDIDWVDLPALERLIAAHPARALFSANLVAPLEAPTQRGAHALIERQDLSAPDLSRLVTPIRLSHGVAGYFSLVDRSQQVDTLDRLMLEQIAPLIALELARVEELAAVHQRLHGDVFDELLAGTVSDTRQALARAKQLGHELSGASLVVVAAPHRAVTAEAERFAQEESAEMPLWARRMMAEAEYFFPGVWARMRAPELVLLVPAEQEAGRSDFFPRFKSRLDELLSRLTPWSSQEGLNVGVGRQAQTIEELPRSHQEARLALMIGQRLFSKERVAYFGELGIYRLLFHVQDAEDVHAFYEEVLGPLVEYDRRTDNDLVETLETYFACNGNLSEAARRLHLHRNSLLYRLERIQEVLQINLEDADTRLSLQVALKMRHTLSS
ncbi:MAG TPA: helix-turn-helix domain-containing protein [Ktedonobacterales bacterium]|nr:helix-turn-helix domain-containing protein [Ktedonobacterales bacterium]